MKVPVTLTLLKSQCTKSSWKQWTSVQNVMAIDLIDVKIFKSVPPADMAILYISEKRENM